ncbi:SusC/RagA family TonB-linked outer membrane protein [uncultured Proteiniphilum sp.]|uniref:SusC/RagA family TonB-linked outer membrane protein n=1 Tax=uncultured Proteiniphilum sp. TaxID=497637 RepID=UPI0026073CDC|nr:SusC/RagA family TonB-linked outer membrane protein [uncultured Proteiniphilum sp.]
MKRKLIVFLTLFFAGIGSLIAQTQVRGIVTDESGDPVIGATIQIKGTSQGTVSDIDGNFTLSAPAGGTLVISFVGYATQEVAVSANVRVILREDAEILDEVVVTALGISRERKALGYSATTVNNERLTESRTTDIMSGIAGKVAGVQITSSSSPGASNSVIIRGISSLSGSNQPLYVVDGVPVDNYAHFPTDGLNLAYDFGSGANAINPDDVESMTILKGAAATALYGNRAANGVILITSKTGKKRAKGLGVEYNGGLQAETVLRLPEFQNEFGIGWSGDYTLIENGSWGPRFDGSMQLWGNVYNNSQKMKPYVALENNVKEFFDTGMRYSNSVSFNNATESNSYFVSLSQITDNGILPTSADSYDRYTFSLRGSQKVNDLNITAAVNYASQENKFVSTGQGLSMVNSIYQMPRDVSIIGLADLNDPFNTPGYYYTPYGVTNPYYILETYQNQQKAEKIFGKFELDYSFLKYFKALYRLGLDASNSHHNFGSPNLKALYPNTPNSSNFESEEGTVRVRMDRRRELNQDFLLTFDMPVNDFQINAVGGFSTNERWSVYTQTEVNGLDLPTWYHLSNSASTPNITQIESLRRLYGVYGQAEIAWRNTLYLTLTARNDWSSTLPKEARSFFYPGTAVSFVFSELLPASAREAITFGKVRLAFGQTGNDANPYMVNPYYIQGNFNSSGFGDLNFPLQNTNSFSLGNVLGNQNLSPEKTTEWEVGLNMGFLKNRISIDAAYYDRNSDKQIFTLNMDPATGYTAQNMNLGKVSNKGIELLLNFRPIEMRNFSWDVGWTFTQNKSKVISLPEELGGEVNISPVVNEVQMYNIVGEPVGTFKAQVAKRDNQGRIIVNASNGLPVAADDYEIMGSINHKYEMGVSTTFRFKEITLSADFDIRQGGKMYSRTKDINYFVGNPIQTAYNDRNTFIVPNSVNEVVAADGSVSYVENKTAIASSNVFQFWGNGGEDLGSAFLIDKSYVKLRSISLGWDLPGRWLANTPFMGVKMSVFGNNLFLWTPSSNTFIDPEMTTFGNDLRGKYGEFSANPTTRRFGFNLNVKF